MDMDYWDLDGNPIKRDDWLKIVDKPKEIIESNEFTITCRYNGFSARMEVGRKDNKVLIDHGPFLVTSIRKSDNRLVDHKRFPNWDEAIKFANSIGS